MASSETPEPQIRLRTACQVGDIQGLQAALGRQPPSWRRTFWHWLRGTPQDDAETPASLAYVYEADQCNLPIHYLATGATGNRCAGDAASDKCIRNPIILSCDDAAVCSASSWVAYHSQDQAGQTAIMTCRGLPWCTGWPLTIRHWTCKL